MASSKQQLTWMKERAAVLNAAKAIYLDGLVVATSGNVSARCLSADGHDLMAVTATSVGYEEMTLDDIVVVDFDGEPILGEAVPSTESLMHASIYAARRDVNAVAHTHSVYASTLAVAGIAIPALIDEMVIHVGDSVQMADYAFPGTEDLATQVVEALGERNAVLLRNHGMVGVGHTMTEALHVCQLVERMAHIQVAANAIGGAAPLPREIVTIEMELFRMRQQSKLEEQR
jgi:L-fuculose-phosphate aldolase